MNLPLWNDKDGLSEYYSEEKIVLRACGDVGTHFNSLHARLCVSACMYACVSAGVRVCVYFTKARVFADQFSNHFHKHSCKTYKEKSK
jgi:hypothetical protein